MTDKLGRAEWGYIAQYETKIYFEKLEEENAGIKELEVSSCQCREPPLIKLDPAGKDRGSF